MIPLTHKPVLEQVDPPRSPRETLPTMYDLPSENSEEPGLPDEYHDMQPQLLSRSLWLSKYGRDRWFAASDLNLYYDLKHPYWYKRPDWFLAVDVPRLYDGKDLRRSYVNWQEERSPYVVIEFLSPGTEAEDLGRFYNTTAQVEASASEPPPKLQVYEYYLRVPYYLVYSRYTQQLRFFKLNGGRYQEQPLNPDNPIAWLTDLDLGVGIWQGVFEGVPGVWLRWRDRDGNWLLTDTEQAEQQAEQQRAAKEQAQQQAEQERAARQQAQQQAEQERVARQQAQQQAERTQAQLLQAAQNLLATGMTIEQVAQLLELSDAQIQALQALP